MGGSTLAVPRQPITLPKFITRLVLHASLLLFKFVPPPRALLIFRTRRMHHRHGKTIAALAGAVVYIRWPRCGLLFRPRLSVRKLENSISAAAFYHSLRAPFTYTALQQCSFNFSQPRPISFLFTRTCLFLFSLFFRVFFYFL